MNYTEQVLVFTINGQPVGATLTVPRGVQRAPAVILAGGALAQGRDGELLEPGIDVPPRHALRRLAHRLAVHGYISIRWDRPGYGSSTWLGVEPRIDDYADVIGGAHRLLCNIKRVDAERVIIVAEDIGAYHAAWLARRGQRAFAHALLGAYGSTLERVFEFNFHRILEYARRSQQHWQWVAAAAPRALAYAMQYKEIFARAHAGLERYPLRLGERSWDVYLPTLREQIDDRPLALLDHLSGPVLVMQGDQDMHVPPSDGDLIASRLRAGGRAEVRQVTVAGGDHHFQLVPADPETRLREYISLACLDRPYLDTAYQALIEWLNETCRYEAAVAQSTCA